MTRSNTWDGHYTSTIADGAAGTRFDAYEVEAGRQAVGHHNIAGIQAALVGNTDVELHGTTRCKWTRSATVQGFAQRQVVLGIARVDAGVIFAT